MEQLLNKINKLEMEPTNGKNKTINDVELHSGKREYKPYPPDFINQVVGVYP